MLALNRALAALGARRIGLVSPYTADVQARIVANYAAAGWDCVAERHFDLRDNFSFATLDAEAIAGAVRSVAPGTDAVLVMCTNMRAAPLVPALEAELGVPVLDSVAAAVWGGLHAAGGDGALAGWGRLFALPARRRVKEAPSFSEEKEAKRL